MKYCDDFFFFFSFIGNGKQRKMVYDVNWCDYLLDKLKLNPLVEIFLVQRLATNSGLYVRNGGKVDLRFLINRRIFDFHPDTDFSIQI